MSVDLASRPAPPSAAELAVVQALIDAIDGVAYLATRDGDVVLASTLQPVEDMPATAMVGVNLFDAIQGEAVRQAYRRLHARALAADGPTVAFEFRCDAPQVRRTMRMSVRALRLQGREPVALYQSQILSAVHRPWISLFEPERLMEQIKAGSALPIVRMCSFCQRVQAPVDEAAEGAGWIEADDYYRSGGSSDVRTSHGVCTSCAERLDL